jgi:tetratricopeptide (TPR) repeat protein
MNARRLATLSVLLLVSAAAAQSPAAKSDAEIKTEADQAQALYNKQDFLGALPLYEDLHAQRPQSLVYMERLAFSLLAKAGQQDPQTGQATIARAKKLLLQAKAGGDNSNLIQTLLEKLDQSEQTGPKPPPPLGHEWVEKGEAAFTSGDLPAAVGFYKKALEVNPQYYAAALFAGDAEYKLNHPAEAGKYFAQAIAINPDIETAHRYWGDCLEKAGDHQRAEAEFIQGIVGEPYSRSPRLGLKQWADANHQMMAAPPIKLPARATLGKNGGMNITLDASKKDDPEAPLALVYSMGSALWQGEKFKKQYPNEKVYRHSLAEEVDSIHTMLAVAGESKIKPDKLSTSTKLLMELEKNGMLECWILLDDADQGIAQDYVAYRKDHRELLAKYIAQYDVHPI